LGKDLASRLDRLAEDHDPLLITRENGKPAVLLISLEDFASWEETEYLLHSPLNAERLLTAVRDLDNERSGDESKLSAP
jgi:antitoxin YefM